MDNITEKCRFCNRDFVPISTYQKCCDEICQWNYEIELEEAEGYNNISNDD